MTQPWPALGAALALAACAAAAPAPEVTRGQALYAQYCTLYHGAGGRGDGPLLEGDARPWTAPDGREVAAPSALIALDAYLETLQES